MVVKSRSEAIFSKLTIVLAICILLKFLCGNAFKEAVASQSSVDFKGYYTAAHRLESGRHLYAFDAESNPYVYTPLVAQMVRVSVASSPFEVAARVWMKLNIACLCLAIFLFAWALRLDRYGVAAIVLLLLTGFRYWPTVMEVAIGNVHMMLLSLVAGMFLCNRYKKWFLMSILVGLAALFKTWCILFCIYFLICRKPRFALFACVFFLLTATILLSFSGPNAFDEFVNNTLFITSRFTNLTLHKGFIPPPPLMPLSHSLLGVANLLFEYNRSGVQPVFPSGLAHASALVLGFVVIVGGFFLAFKSVRDSHDQKHLLLAFCILTVLLLIPLCHVNTLVLALPSIWICSIVYEDNNKVRKLSIRLAAVAIYLILAFPLKANVPVPEEFTHGWKSLLVAIPFFAMFALWIINLVAIRYSSSRNFAKTFIQE